MRDEDRCEALNRHGFRCAWKGQRREDGRTLCTYHWRHEKVMADYKPTLRERQDDLDALETAIRLLSNAADAIEAANTVLRHAKALGAAITDPAIRRSVLKAAGKLKATSGDFYPNRNEKEKP